MKGKILLNRYLITEEADAGGMAIIYAAVDMQTHKKVALKVLRKEHAENREIVERFDREARLVSSLDHPNIVKVWDAGCDQGVHFMVMEFVEGETLKEKIRREGAMDRVKAVSVALDICAALQYAHDNGVVHRDVKPHNVMVTYDGGVKITDFGIAKFEDGNTVSLSDGNVFGSVHYISPEQARGEATDVQTDIYSMGISLYEMLTGVLPHVGETTVTIALKHINEEPVPPCRVNSEVTPALSDVVLKAMAKDTAHRYASIRELARDLIRALSQPTASFVDKPEPAPKAEPAEKKPSSKRAVFLLLALLLIVVAALVTAFAIGRSAMNANGRDPVEVPNVVGMYRDEAEHLLLTNKLKVNATEYRNDPSVPADVVISQSPEGETVVNERSVVYLVVSLGPEEVAVPNVLGQDLLTAQAILEQAGLELGNVTYTYDEEQQRNAVTAQMPLPQEMLTAGNEVEITVNLPEQETMSSMPNVVQMDTDKAVTALRNMGFTYCVVDESGEGSKKDVVVSQSPEGGAWADITALVRLTTGKRRDKGYALTAALTLEAEEKDHCLVAVVEDGIAYTVYEETVRQDGETVRQISAMCGKEGELELVVYINGRFSQTVSAIAEQEEERGTR